MSAKKRSISAPKELFEKADERQKALRYSTFSDYIQALIDADIHGGVDHLREASPPYRVSSAPAGGAVKALQEAAKRGGKKKTSVPPSQ